MKELLFAIKYNYQLMQYGQPAETSSLSLIKTTYISKVLRCTSVPGSSLKMLKKIKICAGIEKLRNSGDLNEQLAIW